jgi:hypothetical protein
LLFAVADGGVMVHRMNFEITCALLYFVCLTIVAMRDIHPYSFRVHRTRARSGALRIAA